MQEDDGRWLKDYSEELGYPKVIQAKDAIIDETYLVSNFFESLVVKKINRHETADFVTSVSVISEDSPGRFITISGGTNLIPYSDEWHAKRIVGKVQKIEQSRKLKEVSNEKRPSRASVIDRELAKAAQSNTEPNWDEIAAMVVAEGAARETVDKRMIMSQARTRFKWYTEQGKINPALVAV